MMETARIWVGIDVAKRTLEICLGEAGRPWQLPNTPGGHRRLCTVLAAQPVAGVVLEATGAYHQAVVDALVAAGLAPAVLNPQWIRAFRRSDGGWAKNDRQDARLLARYGAQKQPAPTRVVTAAERELQQLVAAREDVVTLRTAERNRLQVTTNTVVQTQLATRIAQLTTDLAALEREIDAVIAADPALADRRALLQSMPGIGPVISATLLAYLPELGTMTRRQIAALAGLAPYDQDSGMQRGRRHIAGGRSRIRKAMYQAAITCGADPVLRHRRAELKARCPHKVAMIALARYQLSILTVMVRDHLPWHETRVGQGQYLRHTPTILPTAA